MIWLVLKCVLNREFAVSGYFFGYDLLIQKWVPQGDDVYDAIFQIVVPTKLEQK